MGRKSGDTYLGLVYWVFSGFSLFTFDISMPVFVFMDLCIHNELICILPIAAFFVTAHALFTWIRPGSVFTGGWFWIITSTRGYKN